MLKNVGGKERKREAGYHRSPGNREGIAGRGKHDCGAFSAFGRVRGSAWRSSATRRLAIEPLPVAARRRRPFGGPEVADKEDIR